MKKKIHPKYENATIRCACGNTFETRNTKGDMHVEICSQCHPFFTGKQKFVDSDGRIEKFKKKYLGKKKAKIKPQEEVQGETQKQEQAVVQEQSEVQEQPSEPAREGTEEKKE